MLMYFHPFQVQVHIPEDIRNLLENTKQVWCPDDGVYYLHYVPNVLQCLFAARDGFDADSSSETLRQLYSLEKYLAEGAAPNATLVRTLNIISYFFNWIYACLFICMHFIYFILCG